MIITKTKKNCKHTSHTLIPLNTRALTDCVVPAVDGKQPATCDGDGCWYAKVGERVGRDVSDGGVGRELEHHDDILLHLILKHQWALGKETLVRQTEKERGTGRKRKREKGRVRTGRLGQRGGAGEWRRRERERQNRWDRGRVY